MSSDYLIRQIEDMTHFLASVIFAKKPESLSVIEEDGGISEGNLLRFQLRSLLRDGHVNEAENLLFETVNADPRDEYLPTALDFYETLQAMSDVELEECDFSRAEIADGLKTITALYTGPSGRP